MEVFPGGKYCALRDKQILHDVGIGEDDESLISEPERIYWPILLCPSVENKFGSPRYEKWCQAA